ncbi:hypothetical protein C8A05DRAFT_36477, partial [Staphylotrichum tortipilum]
MCLTKVYYNTYADGAQDISEKTHPCRDGRACSRPDVRRYDRKFPFAKLGDSLPESHRSLSERQPTPYFGDSRGSKSPSPSRRRDSASYMTGNYADPYGAAAAGYDTYGYRSSRHDPRDRDRHDRGRDREPRLKRFSTTPQIIYMDRDRDRDRDRESKSSRSRSNSNSRDYSHDIPLGLVPLADEYGRRHRRHSTSSSRSRSRDDPYYSSSSSSHRRRTDDPPSYTMIDDADERRRQRRERRMSSSSYAEPTTTTGAADGYTDPRYIPRRAATVVHNGDPSSSSSGRKQLRWEDQIRSKRDRQNAEIASRQPWNNSWNGGEVKGILKHRGDDAKGKGRETDEIEDLRRAVERMEMP